MRDVTLSPLQVSDLFFNSGLAHWGGWCASDDDSEGADRAAIRRDAQEFADMLGEGQDPEYIDWLTNDFLKRV